MTPAPKRMRVGYDPHLHVPVLVDGDGNPRGIPSTKPEGEDTFTSAYPPAYASEPILPQTVHHYDGRTEKKGPETWIVPGQETREETTP